MASSSKAGTAEAAATDQVVSARADESSPLIMEEGAGAAKASPTTPGQQVLQGLGARPASAEEEDRANDKAELQRSLESMPQPAVSENSLHEVDWAALGWEFGVNLCASLVLVAIIYFITWKSPAFPFKLYIIPAVCVLAFPLIVIKCELLWSYIQDPDGGCPGGRKFLLGSDLLQAIAGKKVLVLPTASDVYNFAHAIERHSQEPGAFLERVVNPMNPSLPRKLLTVADQEVAPGRWKATAFRSEKTSYSQELMDAANGEPYPTLAQVVEGWIFKDPSFKTPCYVDLTPPTHLWYFHFLWSHWAVRLIANAGMMCLCITPALQYLNTMHKYKIGYCRSGSHEDLPFCGAGEDGGETCKAQCNGLLNFMGEVGSRIGVEEIEFIWTGCLAVVMVGVLSIYYIRSTHKLLETKFILGMGIGQGAESEFMQVCSLLDDNLSFFGIFQGLIRQQRAYRSKLKACEPINPDIYSGAAKIQNPAFWEVTREWRNSQGGKASCKPFTLPVSGAEHYEEDVRGVSQDLPTWSEKMQIAMQEIVSFKNFHGLSRNSKSDQAQKNFKFVVSVPVTCRESLELLKAEFFTKKGSTGYSSQLDAIFASADCQDDPPSASGNQAGFCHVQEDVRLGSLLIPAGMSLTHVTCVSPTNEVLDLEIGKGKDISSREAFLRLFAGEVFPEMNSSLVLESLSKDFGWPPIMLPSAGIAGGGKRLSKNMDHREVDPVDSHDLAARVKGSYIYQLNFIFQIAPPYFQALKQTEKESDATLYGFTEAILTRLKDAPVDEPPLALDAERRLEALKSQSYRDAEGISCSLIVEVDKNSTFRKGLTLLLMLLGCLGLVILCLLFVMIVPMFRHFRWGSRIFPAPFTHILVFNAAIQMSCLVGYFWLFSTAASRLEWIGRALDMFEQRTLAPAADPTSTGNSKASGAASTTFREPTNQGDPFELFISETKDYNPMEPSWVGKWQAKERTVLGWAICARYLRVFVSRTRLTGQAVLVAAALILGVMVLVDLEQGLRGYGAVSLNGNNAMQDMQDELMNRVTSAVQSSVDQAAEVTKSLGEGVGSATAQSLGGRRLLAGDGAKFNFANASKALALALRPIDAAVQRMQKRQLLDFDQTIDEVNRYVNVGDAQHISQTNLLTICMTVLLLVYSICLLAKIAKINGQVDRHESILVQVKESHSSNQSERERLWAATKESDDGAVEPSAAATVKAVEKAQQSYERTLDMSIQSAHENRGRFPLTLFSFIITQALLVAWLAAAMQPLVSQLQTVVPNLLGDACTWAAESDVGSGIEGTFKNVTATVGQQVLGADQAPTTDSDHSMLYSLVCVPLLNALNANMDTFSSDVEDAKNETANNEKYNYGRDAPAEGDGAEGRRLLARALPGDERLLSKASVRRLVEKWWDAYPGGSEAKLELVRQMLEDRARSARQLLTAGPEAARVALRAGLAAAGRAAPRRRPRRSERRFPSLAQRPPLAAAWEGRALFE